MSEKKILLSSFLSLFSLFLSLPLLSIAFLFFVSSVPSEGSTVDVVYLDLSKALDKVTCGHSGGQRRLICGLGAAAIRWILR